MCGVSHAMRARQCTSLQHLPVRSRPPLRASSRPQFLLYKNAEDQVLGLWFYEAADRDSTARLIDRFVHVTAAARVLAIPAAWLTALLRSPLVCTWRRAASSSR